MRGFTRKVDDLGRVCIPKSLRDNYNLNESVEITPTPEGLLLKSTHSITTRQTSDILHAINEEMEKVKLSNPAIYTGLNIAKKAVLGEL
ncbi:MAG: AbrB/MazE/SpoVT family DNA-binding domain-containing protein [Sarcina sp.]